MRNRLTILSALFFILTSATSVSANTQYKNKNIVSLAGIDSYVPYSYKENNQIKGLYIDIIEELFARTEYRAKIKLMPFKRLLSSAQQGNTDGVIGVFATTEREAYLTYVKDAPLAKITQYIYTLKTSEIKSSKIDDIEGKVIAHKRGFIMSAQLSQAAENQKITRKEVETTKQLVLLLLAGRVDGFVQEKANATYFIKKYDKSGLISPLQPPVSDNRFSYLAFSKKSLASLPDDFITAITASFKSMAADGTIDKIYDKYNLAL